MLPDVMAPSSLMPGPPGDLYAVILPESGWKFLSGSSEVMRHCMAKDVGLGMSSCRSLCFQPDLHRQSSTPLKIIAQHARGRNECTDVLPVVCWISLCSTTDNLHFHELMTAPWIGGENAPDYLGAPKHSEQYSMQCSIKSCLTFVGRCFRMPL